MKNFIYISITLLLLLIPSILNAESPKHNILIEPKWGYYFPNNGDWWSRGSADKRFSIFGGLDTKAEFWNAFEVGFGISYLRSSVEKDASDDTDEIKKIYYNSIYMIPSSISLNYKLKFSDKPLFTPYIGTGVDYIYGKEHQVSTVHFHRYGYHFSLGSQIRLNNFAPDQGQDLDEQFGINESYLTLEARYSDFDNLGKLTGHDLSGWFFTMGILLGF